MTETVLWTSEAIVAATSGSATRAFTVSGISIDSRTLEPGDLFVALTDARDGHDFVASALKKGAAAALVSHRPQDVAVDAPLVIVPDVLKSLEALGRAGRGRTKARVLAITGSVGKTSAKEMARQALTGQGRVHASVASYNNHWGVPLTLARMPADTDVAIVEIGMSNPGEIAPLTRMAAPHVAMITTVAPAHLEAFGFIEGIAREKASILEGLTPGRGTAVLNADVGTTQILRSKAARCGARTVLFGASADANWRLLSLQQTEDNLRMTANAPGRPIEVRLQGPGAHHALNALGVLAACEALGAQRTRSILNLSLWVPPEGRGTRERIETAEGAFTLIDDAFNANPASLAAGLAVLAQLTPKDETGAVIPGGRRIAILGDMLELGSEEAELHAEIAFSPALDRVSLVHCVGPRMAHLWAALPDRLRGERTDDVAALIPLLPDLIAPGDIVLVKGSKGSYVSRAVDALRKLGQSD